MNKNLMYIIITLIAVIAVAMVFSGKKPEEVVDSTTQSIDSAVDAVKEAGQEAAGEAVESAEKLGDTVGEATENAVDKMQETGEAVKDKAADMMDGSGQPAAPTGEAPAAAPVTEDAPPSDMGTTEGTTTTPSPGQ